MVSPVSHFDPYTPLLHTAGIDPDVHPQWDPPPWTPYEARRRRHAYRILSTYISNSARFNRIAVSDGERRDTREYGDPRLLTDRIVAGILGSGAIPAIDGAQQPPLDIPELPSRPADPEESDDLAARVHATQVAVWESRVDDIVTDWEQAHADYPIRLERQRWVDWWWDIEQVSSKIYENEANGVVPLGDGVLVVGWSTRVQRPTVTVYEPDAYHPVLADDDREFPEKVHLAWEFVEDDQTKLRRITYELVDLDEPRAVPWSDDPVNRTCVMSDRVWNLNTGGVSWPDLDDAASTVGVNEDGAELDELDLLIDFIPVVHVPNTPATTGHFGQSSLANVAQLFDDIATTDLDIQTAAALAGNPVVAGIGFNTAGMALTAGTIIPLPADGRLDPIDMSGPLAALLPLAETMLDRLSVNSQVPGVVMGRVSGQDVPSGVALSLSFAPFEQLVAILRLTRHVKYGLLLKFGQRIAQVGGILEPGETPAAQLTFATTIPSDVKATVEQVATLLQANGIPRSVGLETLREAGMPIPETETALAQIQSEDTAGARDIADALQSEAAAADYLGLEVPEPVIPEELPPPTVSGG